MLMRLRAFPLALAAAGFAAEPGRTEAVPYTCTIVNDGFAVRINVSNPGRVDRSCLVSCRFQTPLYGGESQIMCAQMVRAGAKDVEMCTKTSGGIQLLSQIHGSSDCIRR